MIDWKEMSLKLLIKEVIGFSVEWDVKPLRKSIHCDMLFCRLHL